MSFYVSFLEPLSTVQEHPSVRRIHTLPFYQLFIPFPFQEGKKMNLEDLAPFGLNPTKQAKDERPTDVGRADSNSTTMVSVAEMDAIQHPTNPFQMTVSTNAQPTKPILVTEEPPIQIWRIEKRSGWNGIKKTEFPPPRQRLLDKMANWSWFFHFGRWSIRDLSLR
jgi:hypothetical protein